MLNNCCGVLWAFLVCDGRTRYVEEVGDLKRTCDDLTTERNAMLVKLEGLKRRKKYEIEVREKPTVMGAATTDERASKLCRSR